MLPRVIKEEKRDEEGVGFLDNEGEKREERIGLSGLALFFFFWV